MPLRRILVLCDTVGTEGGTESYLARLVPALVAHGIHVTLRARHIDEPRAFAVPARAIAWAQDTGVSRASVGEEIRREIDAARPDAVLASNVFDAAVIEAARELARLFVRVHDHRLFCPQGDRMLPHFPRPCAAKMGNGCLVKAVLHGCAGGAQKRSLDLLRARQRLADAVFQAEGIFVASNFMAESLLRNGVDPERIAIVAPPCGPESFARAIAPMPSERRVLFAGRLVRDKGLRTLIRSLARIARPLRPGLDVAGALTPEFRTIEREAFRAGVSLRLLGKLDAREMVAAIDAVRAVVVPSLWPEPFGLVGIEAQARGRPVAAFASGGIADWIGDSGIAVTPGDERALAGAIETVLEAGRWKAFSRAGVRASRRYTPSEHVERLAAVISGANGIRSIA
jgi:glycosyltransferase involved in cell wall biosynthesis